MNSSLQKFLQKATQKTVPDSPALSVPAPQKEEPVESVEVEEQPVTPAPEISHESSSASTPVKPPLSALGKVLAAPKPEKVSTIPSVEKIEAKMLDQISMITDGAELLDPTAEENRFKFELDLLDQKIADDTEIDMFNIDDIRGIIARIMIDWKANPDYDQLVQGKTVHKIMKFMWATQTRAIEQNEEKANKKVKSLGKSKNKASIGVVIGDLDLDF